MIAFGVWWVSEKDACHGTRCEFMSSGGDARITETPKNTKIIIGGRATEEEMMWCKVPTSMTRTNVDEE